MLVKLMGKVLGWGLRLEGPENGWESQAGSCSSHICHMGASNRAYPPTRSSPWAPRTGVSCPSLCAQALQLWTLSLPGGGTWGDGCRGAHQGLRGPQSRQPASFQAVPPGD